MTGELAKPVTRWERAELDAASAAMRSSTDADRVLTRLRPADFRPLDDTIMAAVLDLRQHQVSWLEPTVVVDSLRKYRQLWRDRLDSGKFGLPEMQVPIEDTIDPDRSPLRFAGRALQTCRVYDVMRHLPAGDLDTAIKNVAEHRRSHVADAMMQTVRQILTDPPEGSTRDERQQAIGQVLRSYRRDMNAEHLFARGRQYPRSTPNISR